MPNLRPITLLAAAVVLAADAADARAQCDGCATRSPRGEGLSIAGNALIGGATAAIRAKLNDRPVARAFLAGAAGGAVTYAGKRIVVERGHGAGLLGREVAALGTSLSANAAEGRGMLDRVVLPVGPVRMYLSLRGPGPRFAARVDAAAVAAAAYTAMTPGARIDWDESVSAGALVFRAERNVAATSYDGRHVAGVILLRDDGNVPRIRITSAHERVHVVQYDQTFLLWSAPAENRLMDRAGWRRSLHRWVDLGLNAPVLAGLSAVVPYDAQPWESEARFLADIPAIDDAN